MPTTIIIPKNQEFRYLIEPSAPWVIKSIFISFVSGEEGTRIQPDSLTKHLIIIAPDDQERECWIKVRLVSWDNIISSSGGGGGNGYLPLSGSYVDAGLLKDAMTGENIFFDNYNMEISNTKNEKELVGGVEVIKNSIYSGLVLRPDSFRDTLDIFMYSKKNFESSQDAGVHINLLDNSITFTGKKRILNLVDFTYGDNIFNGLKYDDSLLLDNADGRLHQKWDNMTEGQRNAYIPSIGYVKKMIQESGGGTQTISILSVSPTSGFFVGQTTRITIITSTNANSTNTNIVTISNATVTQVSSTAGQYVADIIPQSAGAINITEFNNNGMIATNLPYLIDNATVPLYKGNWDGINDFMSFAAAVNAAIAAANKFTFEFNLKFNLEPDIGEFMGVAGNYNATGNNRAVAALWDKRAGVNKFCFHFHTNTNGYYEDTNGFAVSTGVNYRVAFVFYGNSFALYKDGVRQQLVSTSGSLVDITELLRIGVIGNFTPPTYSSRYFNGEMYNIALHKADIYSGASYDHNEPLINNSDTLIFIEPKNATNNVVQNTAVGGTSVGNGTLSGVINYTDFYKVR